MAQTKERPTVQTTGHPEVHPDIHPDIHPGVDEFIRETLDREDGRAQRRPVRWMRWLAAAVVLLVGAAVAVLALPGDEPEYAVPRTADGTERWLTYAAPEYAVPSTADGTEGWLTYAMPEYAVPRTADGAVLWFEYLTPEVPRTADGVEGWLASVEMRTAPVVLDLRPLTQLPDPLNGYEMSYRPVTQPTPVVPGEQVHLTVQPVVRPTD